MLKTRIPLLAAAFLLATGCASNKMIEATDQQVKVSPTGKAQVIFIRPSALGGAIQSSLFDVSGDAPEFVGILSAGAKIAYNVEPGKRVFMVVSEAADFLEADLKPATTYYAVVTARMGAWKARFSIFPVRNGGEGEYQYGSDRFQKWLEKTKFYENTPESIAWAEENQASIINKQSKYWSVWKEKTPEALAERTLNPDDGV